MTEVFPPCSAALGFWVKHPSAMEAFEYESDDDEPVPAELQAIFDDTRFNALLDQILDVSVDEGNAIIHAIANEAARTWAQHPNLVIERKRKSSTWSEKFHIRRKRARSGESIEVGFKFESTPKLGMAFYAYLWTKGGKAAAEFNARCVRGAGHDNVMRGSDDTSRYWSNGVLLLARIPLGGFMSSDELESRRFFEHATAQVGKCTGDALAKIVEARM